MIISLICTSVAIIIMIYSLYISKKYKNQINEYNNTFSFQDSMNLLNLPIITFDCNGNKLNFIIDTGSAFSFIEQSMLKYLNYTESTKISTVYGIDGVIKQVNYYWLNLSKNDISLQCEVGLLDLQQAFNNIKETNDVAIHGLLGSDFLNSHNTVLNYQDYTFKIKQ